MSRQRYEPIPQRDEVIILDSIHNSPNYNYNTAIPNSISSQAPSIAESIRTPSIIAASIPNSPPPSFHTHSSPGTPRPTPSTSTRQSGGVSYAELWGVAPSTVGGLETEIGGTSNDALATIAGLKQRIEWLEESIGKLLLEKDSHICSSNPSSEADRPHRDNCCVTFTDASPELEAFLSSGKGSNCCVTFRRTDGKHATKRTGILLSFVTLFMMCVMITIVLTAGAAKGADGRGGRMKGDYEPLTYNEEGRV